MFKLVAEKKGRGIPKGEYNIVKLAFEKVDPEEHATFRDIDTVATKQKMKHHSVVKNILTKNRDLIRDYHK